MRRAEHPASYVDTEAALVVGVAQHAPLSDGTVDLVVTLATGLGLGVELVHVVPTLPGDAPGTFDGPALRARMLADGRGRLDRDVARVGERMAGRQPVEGALVEGHPVASLVDWGRRAELVVLERRRHRGWGHLGGSVTASVSAHTTAPVLTVPAGWSGADGPVVVGIGDAWRASAEFRTAAAMAAATGRSVRVVRATDLSYEYRDVLRSEGRDQELLDRVRCDLVDAVSSLHSARDQPPCSFEARWGRPAEVLIDETNAASMLVLARRDPLLPIGSHLGPTVRSVLRGAACPVLVVDPVRAPLAGRGAA